MSCKNHRKISNFICIYINFFKQKKTPKERFLQLFEGLKAYKFIKKSKIVQFPPKVTFTCAKKNYRISLSRSSTVSTHLLRSRTIF